MSSIVWDLKYALRAIVRQPGRSLAVAVTLALGLGVNATVLGMADALALRPFRFHDYPRLVVLAEVSRGASQQDAVAPANFLDWREQASSFERLVAWEWWDATLAGSGEPERVQGFRVSPGFFELLGVAPTLGRSFTPDEEHPGNDRRAVIGDGLWRRRFGADPDIVGDEVLLDGEPYTIVGIGPKRFAFPVGSEVWVPLAFTPERAADRATRTLSVAGKLAAGRSLADAQAEMDVVGRRLETRHPTTNRERGASVRSISSAWRHEMVGPLVATLQAAAVLVLLVACANIAGVLLAPALERQRELAVRTALGASRGRIARQIVCETVVLGLLASVLALAFAYAGLDMLRLSLPPEIARFAEGWDNLRLDGRLVVAVPLLAIGVGLLVGLIPAVAASRVPPSAALQAGGRGAVGGSRKQRGRQALVVAEIAFALALLAAAVLTVAGGIRLVNRDWGFDAQRLLTLEIPLAGSRYADAGFRRDFADALLARIEGLPSVERAALANALPAAGWNPEATFVAEDQPLPDPGHRPRAAHSMVSPGYFETLRIPVVKGRPFGELDREDTQPVAIVSASLAAVLWPAVDPVGRRLCIGDAGNVWLSVVGVAGDVTNSWWSRDSLAIYRPLRQAPSGAFHVVVRTHGEPASLTPEVRAALRALDPQLPMHGVRTMRRAISDNSLGLTILATLMGICGAIALLLSVVGIYSVMAYAIARRTGEFGVRMALGATSRDVLRLAMRQAAALTAAGVAIGLLLALLFGRLMASSLFGVVALDATTFVAVGLGLGAASLGAAYFPARRILRFDPAQILRAQ
jgi:predicted permease